MARRDLLVRLAATKDRRAISACDPSVARELNRRELIDSAIAARQCWVVERGGAVAGYGVLTTNFFARDFVALLFVAEAHRRNGVGNAILETVEQARRGDRLFTSTSESNLAMRALLTSRHYEPSGTILNLDPADAELVFVKFLR
ncbi:MAG: GNAT family N-acetyltransferase [Alphaproteobacteria bacterium]|nr:GNAT family N-acetyltransferase [Alphaproteobacteria bacterium]